MNARVDRQRRPPTSIHDDPPAGARRLRHLDQGGRQGGQAGAGRSGRPLGPSEAEGAVPVRQGRPGRRRGTRCRSGPSSAARRRPSSSAVWKVVHGFELARIGSERQGAHANAAGVVPHGVVARRPRRFEQQVGGHVAGGVHASLLLRPQEVMGQQADDFSAPERLTSPRSPSAYSTVPATSR